MENNPSEKEEVSAATAVLLGALAPGGNGQTWNTLKIAFLMLGLCLTANLLCLALAFSASDSALIIHVTLLVLITGTLFFLLTSFLAQNGLVTVENQMKEMGLASKIDADKSQ